MMMTNPVTQLNGPEFLAFYAILIVLTTVFCWWRVKRSDTTGALTQPATNKHVDPYEIAYLRGAENELTRVAIVQLMDLGYLKVETRAKGWLKSEQKYIVQADHRNAHRLTALERCVFEWFASGRRIDQVFASGELPSMLRAHALAYDETLHSEQLLISDSVRYRARMTAVVGMGVIAAVGFSRGLVGIMRDRPIGFLVLMGLIGLIAVVVTTRPGRISSRGRVFLKTLQHDWASLQSAPVTTAAPIALAAGLFGVAVLAGTPYAALADAFKKSTTANWAACGAGGGSDGGGGDGGDGGCGGCGGG